MKCYYSGPSAYVEDCRDMVRYIESLGYTITYDWTERVMGYCPDDFENEENKSFLWESAEQDLAGLMEADCLVVDCSFGSLSQGQAVELGYAIALDIPILMFKNDFNMWDPSHGVNNCRSCHELATKLQELFIKEYDLTL